MMKKLIGLLCGTLLVTASFVSVAKQSTVMPAEDVNWGYLNPLRGDKSPGAADLWGDRTKNMPTGMLVRFNKGFSSPPHIHNISYRGIVIKGLMHNDDPTAESLWLPQGSYWTQPAGQNHITAANGEENLIYLEIDSGPYLVQPSKEHFDNGDAPINQHMTNYVWLDKKVFTQIEQEGVKATFLWGSPDKGVLGGTLLSLPKAFKGNIAVDAEEFKVVVIKGNIEYESQELNESMVLNPGSFVDSSGRFIHQLSTHTDTLIYIRTNGEFEIK